VGPGIADALIATAVGWPRPSPPPSSTTSSATRIREIGARMDDFALEFLNMAERSFGE
jgi:biopolymer transport protein TolQ